MKDFFKNYGYLVVLETVGLKLIVLFMFVVVCRLVDTFCTKVQTLLSRDLGRKEPPQPTPGGNIPQIK